MSERDDALLHDMLLAARRITRYMDGVDSDRFHAETMIQDAVIRQLIVLGEAAGAVSEERKAALPAIPWHRVTGMRHRLVHDYRQARLEILWDVASRGLAALLPDLEAAAPEPPEEP